MNDDTSNANTGAKKEFVDRMFNLIERRFDALTEFNEDKKELAAELKGRSDELGFSFKEVARLAQAKFTEPKLREKVSQINDDLATLDFFKDFKVATKGNGKKAAKEPGASVAGIDNGFSL